VTVTNGATAGMTVALMSAAPVGTTVATEAIGHHTLVPLANYLGFTLRGLPIDEDGLVPEALDAACRDAEVRAVFVQPSVVNPTATLMSAARRAAIAEVARKHDLAIIENDVLGPLVQDRAPPVSAFAPERSLYITSFSKIIMPGLRIGYVVAPDRFAAALANRHLVSNWMATPMVAEIATKWVADGTALELVHWQRAALARRYAIAEEMLGGVGARGHKDSLHLWLELPTGWREDSFVAQARLRGVAVAPGSSFRISEEAWRPAVRISLGSTTEAELQHGLGTVATLLRGDPEHLLLAI
jgi:DNA-binding transcriptional MocR family regulator